MCIDAECAEKGQNYFDGHFDAILNPAATSEDYRFTACALFSLDNILIFTVRFCNEEGTL